MKSWTTWLGNVIAQSPRKMSLGSELFQWFIMVYRTIIGVNFHFFMICYDWCCHFPLKIKKNQQLSVITETLFGEMCRSATASLVPEWSIQISRHRSSDWDNIGLSCQLNHLNKHSRWDEWQDKVSFCSLIRLIGVCQPEFLCSRSDSRYLVLARTQGTSESMWPQREAVRGCVNPLSLKWG